MAAEQVVDAFVYHEWSSTQDLLAYLTPAWGELLNPPGGRPARRPDVYPVYVNPRGSKRSDSFPPTGVAGSDPSLAARQLFDGGGRERVVVGYDTSILTTASPHHHAARAVISAINDWTIGRWLAADSRFSSMVLVPSAVPTDAAAEIRRVGSHPGMVAVAMGSNALNLLFGHPAYRPIFEAAVEMELPVVIQIESDLAGNLSTPPMASGVAETYAEYLVLSPQSLMSHAANLVLQGVFDLFPTLKVLFVGGGLTWLPSFLWRMDLSAKFESLSTPWLTRSASEYIRDHVYFTTYQLERAPTPAVLARFLESVPWMADRLVYASGYPNVDMIDGDEVVGRLPHSWHERVFHANADALFRWPQPSVEAPLANAGGSNA